MTSERTSDSERSEGLGEGIWGSFNGFRSVSFWLLVTVAIILLLREYLIYQKGVTSMDDDLSHAAIARFEAIEARLDALENGGDEVEPPVDEEEGEIDQLPTFPSSGSE
jgi:hypothetical protein